MASNHVTPSVEQCCIIRFIVKEKVKTEIFHRLNTQYWNETLSCASVYDRYSKFLKAVKKLKTQMSAGEIMASVFWDSEEMILVDFFFRVI
jgi:hypothetical protein